MKRQLSPRIHGIGQAIPWILGLVLAASAIAALADHLPPGIQVIHVHTPPYLERPPGSGPYSMQDIEDAGELAKLGDAQAQANLGIMYASRGDYQNAAYWYKQAALGGVATAAYNLGALYFNGQGFAKNYVKAHEWFRLAARRGNRYAEFQLGMTYYTGQGVPKKPAREIYWYRKAAHQGLPAAEYNLAVIYHNGNEAPQNDVRAYAWMLLAAKGDWIRVVPKPPFPRTCPPRRCRPRKK